MLQLKNLRNASPPSIIAPAKDNTKPDYKLLEGIVNKKTQGSRYNFSKETTEESGTMKLKIKRKVDISLEKKPINKQEIKVENNKEISFANGAVAPKKIKIKAKDSSTNELPV